MVTRIYEAKNLAKHVWCEFKCKFDSITYNSNQKCNNKACQCKCKSYRKCLKDYSWNPSTCICEISRYLKSIVDESVIVCDEIINVTDSASKIVTNTIPTSVTSIASINSDDKKVRYKMDYYILYTVSLVIILLFIIAIICYHYAKHRSKQKRFWEQTI